MEVNDSNLNYSNINNFIKVSKYSNYMQCPNWAKYRLDKNYFELCVYDKNEIIAYGVAFPLRKYGKNYLYFPRGPIIDYSNIKHLENFRNAINIYIRQHNFDSVLIDPAINSIQIKCKIKNSDDYLSQQYSSQEAIVKLENVEESNLLNVFDGRTRNYIRKSMKYNIQYSISKDPFDLDMFLNLYNKNAFKRNFPTRTKNDLAKFINSNNCLFIQTIKDDIPINMSICILHNNTMYYVLGANNKELDVFHGSYFLHYQSMLYAIRHGFIYYNLGGVYCKNEDKDSPEYGLLRFKKMFAKNFMKFIGEIELE